jgi:hypothetical protein
VAYDAGTGAKLWSKIYNPSTDIGGYASDAVVTAEGTAIVTGISSPSAVTIAYDVATGQKVWRTRSQDSVVDVATALALSPNGRSLYVAGYTFSNSNSNFATWAYRTATGTRRWLSTQDGPVSGYDDARDVVVAPDGTVFVSGK